MTDHNTTEPSKNQPALIAHHVRDLDDGKSFWTRVGAAFASKSGKGYVLHLDAVPLDGRVVLLPPTND